MGIFRVIDGSSLINKTVEAIEREFGVKIVAQFNPYPSQSNSKRANPRDAIYPDLCLEVEGDYENIKKFGLATVDF